MQDVKAFRALVTERVWTKMQKKINSVLGEAFEHAQKGYGQKLKKSLTDINNNDPLGIR